MSSIGRAEDEAVRTRETAPLVRFLQTEPKRGTDVAKHAIGKHVHNANGDALIFVTALSIVGLADAVGPLRKLVEHSLTPGTGTAWPVPWDNVTSDHAATLYLSVVGSGDEVLAEQFLRCLPFPKCLHALGSFPGVGFEERANVYLRAGHPAHGLADAAAPVLEQGVIGGSLNDGSLDAAMRLAELLFRHKDYGAALDILTAFASARPVLPALLLQTSRALSLLSGLALIRAANLLRSYPHSDWLPNLKSVWARLEEELHADFARNSEECSHEVGQLTPRAPALLAQSASAVAMALGVCSAYDDNCVAIGDGHPALPELDAAVAQRNDLADEHRDLVREYPGAGPERRKEINDRVIQILFEGPILDKRIRDLRRAMRASMSAPQLLLQVLGDEQGFPAAVRQSAAWGLWKLAETGFLNRESYTRVVGLIRRSAFNRDEADLLGKIGQLELGDHLTRQVSDTVSNYLLDGNIARLETSLTDLGLSEELRERIVAVIQGFALQTSPSHHFQERVIDFAEGQRFLELERAVVDALIWMQDLIDNPEATWADPGNETDDDWDYAIVRPILLLMGSYVSNVHSFMSQYPLRLMTREQHKRILGIYSTSKAGITRWTRYTPPLMRRGMVRDQAGKVRKRYLEIDNRSAPNAMGISWRLFCHPVLAVPVVYHEFMHYGGPAGDPSKGIDNECEVHLREIVFTRGLIAHMAPENDRDIPEYERSLVQAADAGGDRGLITRLLIDLDDDRSREWLNAYIEALYGRQLSADQASVEIGRYIFVIDSMTEHLNRTDETKQIFDPEIGWPYLVHPESRALQQELTELLHRNLTTNHRLDRSEWARVLADESLLEFEKDWRDYVRRPAALRELFRSV